MKKEVKAACTARSCPARFQCATHIKNWPKESKPAAFFNFAAHACKLPAFQAMD